MADYLEDKKRQMVQQVATTARSQPTLKLNPSIPESGGQIVPNRSMFAQGPVTLPKYKQPLGQKAVEYAQTQMGVPAVRAIANMPGIRLLTSEPVQRGFGMLSAVTAGPVRGAMEETIASQQRQEGVGQQLLSGVKGFLTGAPKGIMDALKGGNKYTWTQTVKDLADITTAQGTAFGKDWNSPGIQKIGTMLAFPLELGLDIDLPLEQLKKIKLSKVSSEAGDVAKLTSMTDDLTEQIVKKTDDVVSGGRIADTMPKRNLKLKQLDPLVEEARKYKSAEEFVKARGKEIQFEKINKLNPMTDDYHTGIRSVGDIKTLQETLDDVESFAYPDFSKEMAETAIRNGKVTIYSSKPLDKEVAQFVSPSKMNASDYAGGGTVYSKAVDVDDVAWINGDEGQLIGNQNSQLTDIWNKAQKEVVQTPTIKLKQPEMDAPTKKLNSEFEKFMDEDNMKKATMGVSEPKPKVIKSARDYSWTDAEESQIKAIIGEEELPQYKKMWNNVFNPIKNAPANVQGYLNEWRRNSLTSRQTANIVAEDFVNIPEEEGWKMIKYMQDPTETTTKQLNFNPKQYEYEMGKIRNFYDEARNRGVESGLDVGYVDNYVNQLWKESDSEIAKRMGVGKTPGFTKEKILPNYETGLRMGLTPKYTHPAQLAAHYEYQLNKAITNKRLVDQLVKSGDILPSSKAPSDWKYLDIPGLPQTRSLDALGNQFVRDYKAPDNIATALNNIFEQDKKGLLSVTGNLSKWMQNVTLSGGMGNLNSFAVSQALKEVTSGRVKSPASAFITAFSDNATKKALASKSNVIAMMAQEGVPLRTPNDYDKLFRNIVDDNGVKSLLGSAWGNLTGDKTFRNFMPLLEANFFEDVYNKALSEGMDDLSARQFAGQSTKNWYGIEDVFSRSKGTQDAINTVFFAPTFREGMVNFWVNNLKSVTTGIADKALTQNRKFMLGSALSYVMYSALNKKLTGHWLHENKSGKELYLEIPRGIGPDGAPRSWYISFLPSIATVPRMLAGAVTAITKGDTATATEKLSRLASQPISLATQLASNKTYYGGQIYKEDDSAMDKYKKLLGYAIGQTTHPYIGEAMDVAQGRKTMAEGVLGALELPVYPSRSTITYDTAPTDTGNVAGATDTLAGEPKLSLKKVKKIGTMKVSKSKGRKRKTPKISLSTPKRYTGRKSSGGLAKVKFTKITTPKTTKLKFT